MIFNASTHLMPQSLSTHRPLNCELSPHKRARLCGAQDSGQKYKQIARLYQERLATVKTTVRRNLRRVSCQTIAQKRQPKKLTPEDRQKILQWIQLNPKATLQATIQACALSITVSTFKQYLKTLTLLNRKHEKDLFLSQKTLQRD